MGKGWTSRLSPPLFVAVYMYMRLISEGENEYMMSDKYRSRRDGRLQPIILSAVDDALQPVLFLDSSRSISSSDGAGEDEFDDGRVEVKQHCPWQVRLLGCLRIVHPFFVPS